MLSDTWCYKFLGFFRASWTMKKLKVVEKAPTVFVVMGICVEKTINTKIKLTCVVFSTKKTSGTAYIEFGKFFNNQEHNQPKHFAEIEKNKNWSKNKERVWNINSRAEGYNKNINPENVNMSTFTKIWSIMRKRRAISHPFPAKLRNLIICWKTLISGQLIAVSFREHSLPSTLNSR